MAILQSPETQNIEFKERWKDDYLKWVCGFANAYGGYIYIGVADGTHEIVGVDDSKRLMEDIPNKIVTNLGIVADVNLRQIDGLDYIEIVVAPCNIPISYKGVYHYRYGSTKQELKGASLQDFLLRKLGKTWDDDSLEDATIDDIDRESIEYFLRKGKLNSDVGRDVGNYALTSTQKRIAERYNAIKSLIKSNPFITAIQLAEKLSVSDRTIERDIAKLQEDGSLIREGDKNGGRWLILK